MSASTLFAIPALAAVATAQFNNAYPTTTMYGQAGGYQNQMMMGSQFGFGGGFGGYQGGGFGGGYGGNYGRQCRSNVRSEDLQGGFQQCYCDKNHRDEDPSGTGKATGDASLSISGDGNIEWQKDYYKDIFDEDCVQQWQQPTNVRRCQKKTRSKDLAGPAVCYCDSSHVKDNVDDVIDEVEMCYGSSIGWPVGEEDAIAWHYGVKPSAFATAVEGWASEAAFEVSRSCTSSTDGLCCRENRQEVEDLAEKYDPNCYERFGGYGGYGQQFGGYGGYGQQQQQMYGFGGQFGGNMFYPTSMQPAAAAPVNGAAPAPTFQFQAQQFGGFPQQQMYGGYGGYRQQQGYYGR